MPRSKIGFGHVSSSFHLVIFQWYLLHFQSFSTPSTTATLDRRQQVLSPPNQYYRDCLRAGCRFRPSSSISAATVTTNKAIFLAVSHCRCHQLSHFWWERPPRSILHAKIFHLWPISTSAMAAITAGNSQFPDSISITSDHFLANRWPDTTDNSFPLPTPNFWDHPILLSWPWSQLAMCHTRWRFCHFLAILDIFGNHHQHIPLVVLY